MTTMIVWLLIATSNGDYNRGNQNTVAMFPNRANCEFTMNQLHNDFTKHKCVMAQIVVPK